MRTKGCTVTNAEHHSILDGLTPLTPFDLSRCETVSEIVAGMSSCSFGARMLGEVADTLTEWLSDGGPTPFLIYDGPTATPLHGLLMHFLKDVWFYGPYMSAEFLEKARNHVGGKAKRVLIVGPYAERTAADVHDAAERIIFINKEMQCRPGQVRDGHFPDVVFSDPDLIMPILENTLWERLGSQRRGGVAKLMNELERMQGAGKETVHGAYTLSKMLADEDCTVMLTLSGAMTIAKMQPLVVDLIETGRIAYVAATGALMAHGLVEGSECQHYKYDPEMTDAELASLGLNRVTDTLEPETNFDHIEKIVTAALKKLSPKTRHPRITCSSEFHRELGRYLAKHHPHQRAILKSAFRTGVPIVTPAFTDSELANDAFVHNARLRERGRGKIIFDQERDTHVLFDLATRAKKLGIFTIGGGVPRNNTQNVAPLIEIYNARLRKKLPPGIFSYGCRIDPAPMALGHMSGCTYSEGASWRKFLPDGMLAEVRTDATIAWPFIQKFALERLALARAA